MRRPRLALGRPGFVTPLGRTRQSHAPAGARSRWPVHLDCARLCFIGRAPTCAFQTAGEAELGPNKCLTRHVTADKYSVVAADSLTEFGDTLPVLDDIDRQILAVLQDDCKTPLARIGEIVGLSAPSVVERVRKLEQSGVIRGYHAVLDGRRLGLDVWAFIGVSINYPKMITSFEREALAMPEVLEMHHVTGAHSLLLKVKTRNTAALEALISRLRSIDGVLRTDTMVVFSTRAERTQVPLGPTRGAPAPAPAGGRRGARGRKERGGGDE